MIEDKDNLNPQQETFCQLYTTEGDTFSNATLAYAEAYGYDFATLSDKRLFDEDKKEIKGSSELDRAYNVCSVNGSKLLRNPKINSRVKELMLVLFNDDDFSDKRLQEIIIKAKPADAINAIKHRNDLKQRITKKLDISTLGRPLGNLTDEELKKLAGE